MYSKTSYHAKKRGRALRTILSFMLCIALIVTMAPIVPGMTWTASAGEGLTVEQPVLLVTGDGIINGGAYTADNIGLEKSYTLDELQDLADSDDSEGKLEDNRYLYSTVNTAGTKKIHLREGIRTDALLDEAGVSEAVRGEKEISFLSKDRSTTLDPVGGAGYNVSRYYYPEIFSGSSANAKPVPIILSWASESVEAGAPSGNLKNEALVSVIGQRDINEKNNSLFNSGVNRLCVGNLLTDTEIKIQGVGKTRAEILLMDRAENTYSYETKGASKTDTVRGVPLATILKGCDPGWRVDFATVDNHKVTASGKTVAQLVAEDYILAYEKKDDDGNWKGIYTTAKDDSTLYGYFTLYGADGSMPAGMITDISAARVTSSYKHIDNGGLGDDESAAPYNLDSITGATLTVEGPGVTATTPIRVSDLEATSTVNISSGYYEDGNEKEMSYEGVDVLSIIDGKVNGKVKKNNQDIYVIFKSRERKDLAAISYANLKKASEAGRPVLIAYGIGDGKIAAPFVFNNATGYIDELGNDDGPLRLVFDPGVFAEDSMTNAELEGAFKSSAYIYVENGEGRPGYKHSQAEGAVYNNSANTEYIVTFTGSGLGREVNYTVSELEEMVKYDENNNPQDGGIGHRASYGLSNTTYWYVNEYEGVKLWDLLQKMGVDPDDASDAAKQKTTVSFAAWDNYQTTASFTYKQLADPDNFYFYEKSPMDVGTNNRPTKRQLSMEVYQPTYTEDERENGGWETDSNNYPVKKGYPVMLAYGVNGYPYVLDKTLDGYSGGLGNDGGPLKVIFGKTDGMNTKTADALENYAYFYNNGSNQLQRAQEIYVGDSSRYSTHLQNPNAAYSGMKDVKDALTIEVKTDSGTTTKNYTLGELEGILYAYTKTFTKKDMDLAGSREKGYYLHESDGGSLTDDLFEGINLEYLLFEKVGLQGTLGTVELYSGDEIAPDSTVALKELGNKGYNSVRGTSGIGMMIAFAKNGYPLVLNEASGGYVETDSVTGKKVENGHGPLMFVRPQTSEENAEETINTDGSNPMTVKNLTKIVVDLQTDPYSHVGEDYSAYGANEITFKGSIGSDKDIIKTVSDLEKLQRYMVTGTYTVKGSEKTYRGLDLRALLNSNVIGASSLMGAVIVKNESGKEATVTVEDLNAAAAAGKRIILAYGTGDGSGDGKPLVPDEESAGWVESIGNENGPMCLIVDDDDGTKLVPNVKTLEVTATELKGWTHSGGKYLQYAKNTLEISGLGLLKSKNYTVAQLESLSNLIVRDQYKVGNDIYVEGIDLYKLLKNLGYDEKSSAVTYAEDGYSVEFSASQLKDGVNKKPVLIGYAVGKNAADGLPLVPGDASKTVDGYDKEYDNAYGPIRIFVHDNNGWSNKYLKRIVVGKEGSNGTANDDFIVKGVFKGASSGDLIYDINKLGKLNTASGSVDREYSYKSGDSEKTDKVRGVYLAELIDVVGIQPIDPEKEISVTVNTTNDYEKGSSESAKSYVDIPLSTLREKNYLIAYEVMESGKSVYEEIADTVADKTATIRIYRNHSTPPTEDNRMRYITGITLANAMVPETVLEPPLTIKGIGDSDITCGIEDTYDLSLKTGVNGKPLQTSNYSYAISGVNYKDYVQGVFLSDLLEEAGIPKDMHSYVTIHTTNDANDSSYRMIPLEDIKANKYFLAYRAAGSEAGLANESSVIKDVDSGNVRAAFRLYYTAGKNGFMVAHIKDLAIDSYKFTTYEAKSGGDLPPAGIRSIALDSSENLWVGTYGGGLAYRGKNDKDFMLYTTPLRTNYTSAVAVDSEGGVWFSQNASYEKPKNNSGVGYLKGGKIFWYTANDKPKTIPNNYVQEIEIDPDGNVWFGSFGGVTKYDPIAGTWKTWTKEDGLPATSVNTIAFDGKDGLWIGCYPDGTGTKDDLFVGGYAHMNLNGAIDFSQSYTGKYDENAGSLLADAWVRGITVDAKGDAWIVRSGSHPNMATIVGGRLDRVSKVDNQYKVKSYTGHDLLGDYISRYSEIRAIAADHNGGLWLGTTLDGVLLCHNITADIESSEKVKQVFAGASQAWPKAAALNNIYSLDLVEESPYEEAVLYVGSAGGLAFGAVKTPQPASIPGEEPGSGQDPTGASVGDATKSTAKLSITGEVEKPGYFTVEGLQKIGGKIRKTYHGLNTFPKDSKEDKTPVKVTFEGIYVEDLLKNVMTLTPNAKSIKVQSGADSYNKSFNLRDDQDHAAYWVDRDGNQMMLAWEEDGEPTKLRLVVGQANETDANQPMWVQDVISITVGSKEVINGEGTLGEYERLQKEKVTETPITETVAATIKIVPTVKDGTATGTVETADVVKALAQAKREAKSDVPKIALLIDATTAGGDTARQNIVLTGKTAEALLKEKNVSVKILTDIGTFALNAETLKELMEADGAQDLVLKMDKKDALGSDAPGKAKIGDRPVVDITLLLGGKELTSLNGQRVKAGIHYTSAAGEDVQKLVLYRINDDGTTNIVKLSAYDGSEKVMEGALGEPGRYAVGYNDITFTDVAGHWARSSVEFLAAREIINGKAKNIFDPNGNVTRAEFLKMLAEAMDGVNVKGSKNAGFTDVAASWYTDYVNWGAASGIVSGYPDGSFKPGDKITREQMAVMLSNFIKYAKTDLDTVNELIKFQDQDAIGTYAASAVAQMQQCGMISGYPDGGFKPKGTATRAESAAMIERYIKAFLQ